MATPMQDPPASGEDVTAAELDEVERLDKAATPGPWIVNRFDCEGGAINWQVQQFGDPAEVIANVTDDEPRRARHDARLIAAARTLLPRLARALRAAEKVRFDLEAETLRTRGAYGVLLARLDSAQRERDGLSAMLGHVTQERDHAHARGRREAIEEAAGLREKARAVCELEWEGAWRLSDDDTLLFSALRAEVDR